MSGSIQCKGCNVSHGGASVYCSECDWVTPDTVSIVKSINTHVGANNIGVATKTTASLFDTDTDVYSYIDQFLEVNNDPFACLTGSATNNAISTTSVSANSSAIKFVNARERSAREYARDRDLTKQLKNIQWKRANLYNESSNYASTHTHIPDGKKEIYPPHRINTV